MLTLMFIAVCYEYLLRAYNCPLVHPQTYDLFLVKIKNSVNTSLNVDAHLFTLLHVDIKHYKMPGRTY